MTDNNSSSIDRNNNNNSTNIKKQQPSSSEASSTSLTTGAPHSSNESPLGHRIQRISGGSCSGSGSQGGGVAVAGTTNPFARRSGESSRGGGGATPGGGGGSGSGSSTGPRRTFSDITKSEGEGGGPSSSSLHNNTVPLFGSASTSTNGVPLSQMGGSLGRSQLSSGHTTVAAADEIENAGRYYSRSHRMYHRLWYNNTEVERRFMVREFHEGHLRFLVLSLAILLGCSIRLFMGGTPTDIGILVFLLFGISLVAAVLELVLILLRRKCLKNDEVSATLHHSSYERKGARVQRSSIRGGGSSRSSVSSTLGSHRHRASEKHLQHLAVAHEVLSFVTALLLNAIFTYVYARMQASCTYVSTSYDGRKDHEKCPTRFFVHWFWGVLTPLITGQPRFAPTIITNVVTFVFLAAILHLHDTSTAGVVLVVVFCGFYLLSVSILKFVDEAEHRRRFEAHEELHHQERKLRHRSAALQKFVMSITPKYLQSRLTDTAFRLQVDYSSDAVCIVLDVFAVNEFLTSMLPLKSACAIVHFAATCTLAAHHHDFHHIRAAGDTQFLVANLFDERGAAADDSLMADGAAERAVALVGLVSESSNIPLRCGVSRGHLFGMPLGSVCIRYDIMGPALTEAMNLVLVCEKRSMMLSPAVADAARQWYAATLPLQPSSDISSAATDVEEITATETTTAVTGIHAPPPPPAKSSGGYSTSFCNLSSSQSGQDVMASHVPFGVSIVSLNANAAGSGGDAAVRIPTRVSAATTTDGTGKDHHHHHHQHRRRSEHFSTTSSTGGAEGDHEMSSSSFSRSQTTNNHHTSSLSGMEGTAVVTPSSHFSIKLGNNTDHLELQTACCGCGTSFADAETEHQAHEHHREQHAATFVVTNALSVVAVLLLLHMSIVEDRDQLASSGAGIVSLVVLGACALLFAANGMLGAPQSSKRSILYFCIATASLVAANLSRPSLIGNACGYLVLFFSVCGLFVGAAPRWVLRFQALQLIIFLAMGILYNRLFYDGEILLLPFSTAVISTAILHNRQNWRQFANLLRVREAIAEVNAHDQVRESIHDALIPRSLRNLLSAESMKTGTIKAWGVDECMVMMIKVPAEEALAAGATTANDDGSEGGGVDAGTSAGAIEASAALNMQRQTQRKTTRIEALVKGTKNGTLHIVRAFGGCIVVAGPLTPDNCSDGQQSVMDAVQDMLELLHGLLEQQHELDETDGKPKLPPMTVGVAVEQAIHVLKLDEFPSYDLLGPAVSLATSLVHAAPTNMMVLSEKLVTTYLQSQPVVCGNGGVVQLTAMNSSGGGGGSIPSSSTCSTSLRASVAERWKLRHWGCVKIQRVLVTKTVCTSGEEPIAPMSTS